jgi:endonuclease-3
MSSTPNRTTLLTKIHRVLKKHYKPHAPRGEQPVFESLLFACCLENAPHDVAERVFEAVKTSYFGWNEVRVTTVKELSEVMSALPDPAAAATNLKSVLQNTFESEYEFSLESIKKKNLGDAIKRLQKLVGGSPFAVAYATQVALGGHSIPVDRGALSALYALGAITEAEQSTGTVPGMERAIPKSKGMEFGSLLHELSVELVANPFSPQLRDFLTSITPDAKERMPKRVSKKPAPEPEPPKPELKAEKKAAESTAAAGKKKDAAPRPKKSAEPIKPAPAAKKKPVAATAAGKKKPATKTLSKRKPR